MTHPTDLDIDINRRQPIIDLDALEALGPMVLGCGTLVEREKVLNVLAGQEPVDLSENLRTALAFSRVKEGLEKTAHDRHWSQIRTDLTLLAWLQAKDDLVKPTHS